jgi:2-haloacid dehalogenase
MKPYRTLLFDLDDTLLDIAASRVDALRATCEAHGVPYDDAVYARFDAINTAHWRAYEEGRMSQAEVMRSRHVTLFGELGHAVDGDAADATYRRHLSLGFHAFDGALDLVRELAEGFALYVVSNGVSPIQASRLHGSGLLPHFRGVFVSEDTGHQKPQRGFFDHVFARIPGFDPAGALIIGDSLTADVAGGHGAGIDTCWYNPHGKPNHLGLAPTHEIRDYDALRAIVGVATPASRGGERG